MHELPAQDPSFYLGALKFQPLDKVIFYFLNPIY